MDYLDFLYASDGTGEAVRAVVTGTRTSGATTLEVDSLNNWPTKFVATVGTLNESTGIIDPDTVTVFKGHSSGGDIIIDQIAPGYADDGNTVGQVVVLKPATFWVDTLAAGLAVFFNTDGTPKNNSVPTAAIADRAVTASKLDLSPQYIRQDNAGTTTSAAFTTSLSGSPGTNPSITLDLQVSSVMVIYGAQISNSSTGQLTRLGVDISGATTLAAETNGSLALRSPNTNAENISYTRVITGLTPGSNTFRLAYATAGGTATYEYRFLTVIPIG